MTNQKHETIQNANKNLHVATIFFNEEKGDFEIFLDPVIAFVVNYYLSYEDDEPKLVSDLPRPITIMVRLDEYEDVVYYDTGTEYWYHPDSSNGRGMDSLRDYLKSRHEEKARAGNRGKAVISLLEEPK